MRPRFNRWNRDPITAPPRSRETADIRRTDKLLALLEARLASHDTNGLIDWLRASPIAGADETSRVACLLRLNRLPDIVVRTMARDVLR